MTILEWVREDTLKNKQIEESVLKKLSFDEKKFLLGAINGVIDRNHPAWLLSIEKNKINKENKKIGILELLFIVGIIISLILAASKTAGWGFFIIISAFYLMAKAIFLLFSITKRIIFTKSK